MVVLRSISIPPSSFVIFWTKRLTLESTISCPPNPPNLSPTSFSNWQILRLGRFVDSTANTGIRKARGVGPPTGSPRMLLGHGQWSPFCGVCSRAQLLAENRMLSKRGDGVVDWEAHFGVRPIACLDCCYQFADNAIDGVLLFDPESPGFGQL